MNTNTPHPPIHETVERAIREGRITMRSSVHFAVRTVLVCTALLGIALVSTVIANFILFSIHVQSHHELLGFGLMGLFSFLLFFPWLLLVVDVGLIVLVLTLLKSFRFGYKTPTLYLILMLLAAVGGLGVLLERHNVGINAFVISRPEIEHVPLSLMRMVGIPPPPSEKTRALCRCEVVSIESHGVFRARDIHSGEMYLFQVRTHAPYATTTLLVPGDRFIIAGTFDGDDVIDIYGLKRLPGAEPHPD